MAGIFVTEKTYFDAFGSAKEACNFVLFVEKSGGRVLSTSRENDGRYFVFYKCKTPLRKKSDETKSNKKEV